MYTYFTSSSEGHEFGELILFWYIQNGEAARRIKKDKDFPIKFTNCKLLRSDLFIRKWSKRTKRPM